MSYTVVTRPTGHVAIEFERTDGIYKFVDAIVIGPSEYASLNENDIEQMIEQRWQDFLIMVTPKPEPEVTDVEFTEEPQGE